MKFGQTQIISVVLIIGIVVGGLSMIVPWSMSMIEKKKDAKTVEDTYNFFLLLDSTISNVAQNGGEESLVLKTPGMLTIYPNSSNSENNNSIIFNFTSKVSNVAISDWIPLNTPNLKYSALLGTDPMGVVFGRAEKKEGYMNIQYKLFYRELDDKIPNPTKRFKIELYTTDQTIKQTTTGFIKIQRIGSYDTTDVPQPLTITQINIIV